MEPAQSSSPARPPEFHPLRAAARGWKALNKPAKIVIVTVVIGILGVAGPVSEQTGSEEGAQRFAQEFITRHLLCPATASFPWSCDVKANGRGE